MFHHLVEKNQHRPMGPLLGWNHNFSIQNSQLSRLPVSIFWSPNEVSGKFLQDILRLFPAGCYDSGKSKTDSADVMKV